MMIHDYHWRNLLLPALLLFAPFSARSEESVEAGKVTFEIADPDALEFPRQKRTDLSVNVGGGMGVVIAPHWVLTASHCISSKREGVVPVRYVDADGKRQTVVSDKVIYAKSVDIALVRLVKQARGRTALLLLKDGFPVSRKDQDTYQLRKVAGNSSWEIPAEVSRKSKGDRFYISASHRKGKAGTSGSPWVIHSPIVGDVLVGVTHGSGRVPQVGKVCEWIQRTVSELSDDKLVWATPEQALAESPPASKDKTGDASSRYPSDRSYKDLTLDRIAFGSCNKPQREQGFWDVIREQKPDVMLLLGDNHYVESTNPEKIAAAYRKLEDIPGYMALRKSVPTFAIWDNHDYGAGYPGRHHPQASESEQLFLDHFRVAKDDPRQERTGIYGAWIFGKDNQRVQIIMLDTHRNRDYLKKQRKKGFVAEMDPTKTMLGKEQWTWLEQELQKEADVRIIGTSIQYLSNEHGWRRWGMFPLEKKRLLDLLDNVSGSKIFLTGDRHRGEISKLERPGKSTLYDITASAFNSCYKGDEPNALRIGPLIDIDHFGTVEIDWTQRTLNLKLLASKDAAVLASHLVKIDQKNSDPSKKQGAETAKEEFENRIELGRLKDGESINDFRTKESNKTDKEH